MKNTSGSLNVLFLKKCWRAIELTCFKGEVVNKPERIGFVAVLYPTIIGNAEATALVLRIINQKKASQEIREILKNFQAPPPASKQPNIPYGKCVMSHFGNIDILTKFEPLKMQIFHCPRREHSLN